MALQKPLPTPFKVDAPYWRIVRINSAYPGKSEVLLAGYVSDVARQAGAEPLDIKAYYYADSDLTRNQAYDKLKLEPDFVGALDV